MRAPAAGPRRRPARGRRARCRRAPRPPGARSRGPSPEPGRPRAAARAVEAVEDEREVLVRDPRPVVAHGQLPVAQRHLDRPAGGAVLGGVVEQVRDRAVEPAAHAVDDRRLEVASRTARPGAWRAARADRRRDELVEPQRLALGRPAPPRARGRRGRRRAASAPRAGRPRRRAAARGRRRPRPPRPSTSRLVRSEVSGVRSSCEASATSRRCARWDASSASSIVLNAPASRDSSSSPSCSIRRVRSRVRATCSAASVSSATGRTAARVASRASTSAAAIAEQHDHARARAAACPASRRPRRAAARPGARRRPPVRVV